MYNFLYSGALSLVKRLDRNSPRQFELSILASDHGRPSLTAEQVLNVFVENVNSNAPRFLHSVYRANVSENSPPGSFVAQVQATAESSASGKKNNCKRPCMPSRCISPLQTGWAKNVLKQMCVYMCKPKCVYCSGRYKYLTVQIRIRPVRPEQLEGTLIFDRKNTNQNIIPLQF